MVSRVAGWPSDSRLNRRLVRAGSPSPANIRAGSSFSRLNGKTPAVNGKRPGRFSRRQKRTSSPWSSYAGSATRGIRLPDRDSRPGCSAYSRTTDGHCSSWVLTSSSRSACACVASSLRRRRAPRRPAVSRCARRACSTSASVRRVVAAHGLGDLGEVADPVAGDDLPDPRRVADVDPLEDALVEGEAAVGEQPAQVLVERGDAVVVERRRAGAEDRHLVRLLAERLAVADQLAADVAQRVLGAAALELVDRDDVGEVEHVDLLELGRGAVLRRHDVEAGVGERDDRRVALADARRLDDDEVEAAGLEDGDDVVEVVGELVRAPGRQRPEVGAVVVAVAAERRGCSSGSGRRAARRRPCAGSGRPPRPRSGACPAGRRGSGVRARRSGWTCPSRRCR